jgi:hypothetical protein
MKEELKKFLVDNHSDKMWYGYSTEGWMSLIDDFFNQYQPERSKREDSCKHELYPEEYKEEKEGYIFRKCKKCDEKLYAQCL